AVLVDDAAAVEGDGGSVVPAGRVGELAALAGLEVEPHELDVAAYERVEDDALSVGEKAWVLLAAGVERDAPGRWDAGLEPGDDRRRREGGERGAAGGDDERGRDPDGPAARRLERGDERVHRREALRRVGRERAPERAADVRRHAVL